MMTMTKFSKKSIIIQTLLTSTLFFSYTIQAKILPENAHTIADYQQQAQNLQLAQHITWQRLFYFNVKEQSSKVSSPGFFLDPQGKTNLVAELNSSIKALLSSDNLKINNIDQTFRCRFPARSQWLIEQLHIPNSDLPNISCPELDTWFKRIQPYKITMIFATDFMGNPSSMFGHTLLRIDPKDQKDLNLVSYALNYAATPDQKDNDFAYAWKGLTGQYPSEYSLMSYFHKVKEYGDLESRDLWEYELNLNPEDTVFLVKHIWELQDVRFPYYFVSDNCAYALLGLFDLVHPELNLQQQFGKVAIPIETIKALQEAKLIKDVVYRPSLETQLMAQVKQHGSALAKDAHHLTTREPENISHDLKDYTPIDQAKILEMAYDDLYLAFISRRVNKEFAQPRLRALLAERSRLDIAKQRQAPEQPKFNPVEGHHSRTLVASLGQVQDQDILELEHRQAYHDLIDPQSGQRFGTQLIFLQGKAQIREDQLKLEHVKLMSVNSLNPINPFKTPLSWGMQIGWQQEAIHEGEFNAQKQHGVLNLNAQAGYSLATVNHGMLCYAQLQGIVQAGKALDKGWRIAPAPTFGCLNQWSENVNSTVQIEVPYWLDQEQWNLRVNTQWQYAFNPNNALRLNWQYQQQNSSDWHKFGLGFAHYF